jgi:hypothetical protein
MTLRSLFLSAVVTVGLVATPVAAFNSQNNFTVRRLDNNRFEVLPRGGLGASNAWCAASDFVVRSLQLPRNTQIWRISEPPQRSGQSIVFSISSEGAASSSGLASIGGGASISAAHGLSICSSLRDLQRNR